MGIKIKPGAGEAAARELATFTAAYPVNQVGTEAGILLFWLPAGREDEAACFELMEFNSFCGTFDVVAYILR